MSLKLRHKEKSVVPPLENGVYFAVCVGVIDLGHQYSQKFKTSTEKLMFIFEIPSERVEVDGEDKPRWLSSPEYTNSDNPKAKLPGVLSAWMGKELSQEELRNFDTTAMLGRAATLQVLQSPNKKGEMYANIAAITGLPKGIAPPQPENELMVFDMDAPDESVFEKLPEWIQKKIKASEEYADSHVGEEILDIDTETGEVIEKKAADEVPF